MSKEQKCMIDRWADLPLVVYEEIQRIDKTETDESRRTSAIISELADLPVEDVEALPALVYQDMKRRSAFLFEAPSAAPRYRAQYRLGDFVLTPTTRVDKIIASQYIDFQTVLGKKEADLASLLAVVLVPKGKTYGQGYDIADVKAAIYNYLGLSYIVELKAFFLTLCESLTRFFRTYYVWAVMSRKMVKKKEELKELSAKLTEYLDLIERLVRILRRSGDGWPSLTGLAN